MCPITGKELQKKVVGTQEVELKVILGRATGVVLGVTSHVLGVGRLPLKEMRVLG